VTWAAAVVYRKRREQGMEIRCSEASGGDEFPWCKTPGKDVIADQQTIARDVGFFLVFVAGAAGAGPGVRERARSHSAGRRRTALLEARQAVIDLFHTEKETDYFRRETTKSSPREAHSGANRPACS